MSIANTVCNQPNTPIRPARLYRAYAHVSNALPQCAQVRGSANYVTGYAHSSVNHVPGDHIDSSNHLFVRTHTSQLNTHALVLAASLGATTIRTASLHHSQQRYVRLTLSTRWRHSSRTIEHSVHKRQCDASHPWACFPLKHSSPQAHLGPHHVLIALEFTLRSSRI